jgi:hypothetical protein
MRNRKKLSGKAWTSEDGYIKDGLANPNKSQLIPRIPRNEPYIEFYMKISV